MSPLIVKLALSRQRAKPKSVIHRLPFRVDEQVGRLDVTVNHALVMRVFQGLGGLHAELGDRAEERRALDRAFVDGSA